MAEPGALATLLRLRRLEVLTAQRELAERLEAVQMAQLAVAAAAARLDAEGMAAVPHAGDFMAWLPRGLAQLRARETELARAEAAAEGARGALLAARTAENATEALHAEARREAARAVARKDQMRLDEIAARRS